MIRCRIALGLFATALLCRAAPEAYEVRGQLDPPHERATVVLSAVHGSFMIHTSSDAKGRFRFGGVLAGEYSICVFAPGFGESLRTVDLSPESVGQDRKANLTIHLSKADAATGRSASQYTVSLQGLAIPDEAQREVVAALESMARNDAASAARRLQHAVEIAPNYPAAWNALGTIAYHERKYEDAEGFFRKAHELDPAAFDPAANLGGVLLNLGRYEDALPMNTAAVSARPHDALANSQMGLNCYLLGKLEEALRFLKEAKRIDPAHFTHPQRWLSEIYLKLLDKKAARAELEDLAARDPGNPEAAQALARLAASQSP